MDEKELEAIWKNLENPDVESFLKQYLGWDGTGVPICYHTGDNQIRCPKCAYKPTC
jgi:hypothetical protein